MQRIPIAAGIEELQGGAINPHACIIGAIHLLEYILLIKLGTNMNFDVVLGELFFLFLVIIIDVISTLVQNLLKYSLVDTIRYVWRIS